MDTSDTYNRMKVKDLRAELKSMGKSTKGNKSVLIHRLRDSAESADAGSGDGEQELDTETNEASSNALTLTSKEDLDQTVKGNAIFNWALQLLNTHDSSETDDIPMNAKLMTDNNPDLSLIRRLLLVIASADIAPQKKPSPTETIERLKTIISQELPTAEVVYQGTAEMLQKLGMDGTNIEVQDVTTQNVKMDAALNAFQQAILSWLLISLRAHDESQGSTFPDSFNSTERLEIRKWARKWIKDNDINPSELSGDQINAAAADPEIPNARVKESVACVQSILRQICSEMRRDKKAKKTRQDGKRAAGDIETEEEDLDDEPEAAAGSKKMRRLGKVVEVTDED